MNSFLASVTDPTDFSSESLSRLDTSLRCPICKEFLDGPVNLNCGHSFCSLCIRDYLRTKQECPCCRAHPALEIHLKKNLALEESVLAWKDSRKLVLSALKPPATPPHVGYESPRKKRRLSEIDEEPSSSASSSKRSSATSLNSKLKSPQPANGESLEDVIEIPDSDPVEDTDANGLVLCPACNKRIQINGLNDHLDRNCKDAAPKQVPKLEPGKGLSSFFAAKSGGGASRLSKSAATNRIERHPREPIAKFSYDTMKLGQLREKLSSFTLPETGSRDTLVARLEHWSKIYNANLDRKEELQLNDSALRAELLRWEAAQAKLNAKDKTELPQDLTQYEKDHSTQFAQLIADVKASAQKTKVQQPTAQCDDNPPIVLQTLSQRASAKLIVIDED
ncbi:DNA repair protein rad18, partial [Auriculariales sp. MPI-PUGE-AT-0066]